MYGVPFLRLCFLPYVFRLPLIPATSALDLHQPGLPQDEDGSAANDDGFLYIHKHMAIVFLVLYLHGAFFAVGRYQLQYFVRPFRPHQEYIKFPAGNQPFGVYPGGLNLASLKCTIISIRFISISIPPLPH